MKILNSIRIVVPLILFVGLAIFLAIGLTKDPRLVPSPFIGKAAPDFNLSRLYSDSEITQGVFLSDTKSIRLLNVWASWCPECWREHGFLMQLAESGIDIIGLNYKDEDDKAKAMLDKSGNPFTAIAVDLLGKVGIDYGVYGAPETFIINNKGIILYKKVGGLNPQVWKDELLPVIQNYMSSHEKS